MNKIDTRIVKASFRDCAVSDRKFFHQSKCIMPISVGQPIHEGKKFLATIKLINASFKSCTVLIDDSVQRHTMKISRTKSDEILYSLAIKEGDNWLARNEEALKTLTIPHHIMRWDDWLINSNFKQSYAKVKNEYSSNENFRAAIHANIEEFLSRYFARLPVPSKEQSARAFSLCLYYLLEECAVMCLWVQGEYQFEIYPSGRNKAMAATYEYLIQPHYPNFLKSVALRFKKYPNNNYLNYMQSATEVNNNAYY